MAFFQRIMKKHHPKQDPLIRDMELERDRDFDFGFRVEPEDVLLISFPKSGNTWMRFMLANLIAKGPVDLINIEEIIVDIYKNHNTAGVRSEQWLNIFKSHSPFRIKYSHNQVVYLVRDPRDAVISYYYYYLKTTRQDIEFDRFFDMWVNGDVVYSFGSWGENVGSWLGAKKGDEKHFLLVKYEDLLSDTKKELQRVAAFLELQVSPEQIETAIANSQFNKLRHLEDQQEDIAQETKETDKTIKFFRQGTRNQWQDMLSSEQLEVINQRWGYLLEELGYKEG